MRNFIAIFLLCSGITINAQNVDANFFQQAHRVFQTYVQNGRVDYQAIKNNADFNQLIKTIAAAEFDHLDANSQQAYLINAYNLLVINEVVRQGLMESVQENPHFFDAKTNLVAGKRISLNILEKDYLLKNYGNPNFHFVLVCGAKGCPPITNFAYMPEQLEQQMEKQTRQAINDSNFIKVDYSNKKVSLSQIFNWYAADFGGNKKAVLEFINTYRNRPIPSDFSVNYYQYDWALNGQLDLQGNVQSNNSSRYVVSAAIPKGTTETKIFNNLYTQQTRSNPEGGLDARSNFFTTSVSFLYGLSNRFNAGFDLRYRRVSNTAANVSPLNVLTNNATSRRSGITNIGPKIRWAPFEQLTNFSVQSALWFPIGTDLQGNNTQPYIDWDGATWNTQLFNDFSIGSSFSLFTELDFLLEDIGRPSEGDLNRFSTPATVILSYFPNPKTTLYALTNFSPYWQSNFDYFAQAGLGAKYQVNPNLEFELLYTAFTNQFLANNNGQASTFNIGVRFSR